MRNKGTIKLKGKFKNIDKDKDNKKKPNFLMSFLDLFLMIIKEIFP